MKTPNLTFEKITINNIDNCVVETITKLYETNFYRAFGSSYPNVKYSCPICGTLDVQVNLENSEVILGKCLDCNSIWEEDYLF